MLTFDNHGNGKFPRDPLKALVQKNTPDTIDIGETNDYWLFVRRSTGMIEFLSKQTGGFIAKCAVGDAAKAYGLSAAQVSAAKSALAL